MTASSRLCPHSRPLPHVFLPSGTLLDLFAPKIPTPQSKASRPALLEPSEGACAVFGFFFRQDQISEHGSSSHVFGKQGPSGLMPELAFTVGNGLALGVGEATHFCSCSPQGLLKDLVKALAVFCEMRRGL